MCRLIDADSYLKNFCKRFCDVKECTRTQKKDCCIAISLEEQPTFEAVPVVHGEWIYTQYHTWECGNCGFHPFKGYIPKEPDFNFCPKCGADMRKNKIN